MQEEFSWFRLSIAYAGAGSVIYALQADKMSVVMPRLAKYGEIVDNHQLELARAIAETAQIVVAEESGDLIDAVAEALRLQRSIRASHETPRMVGLISAVLREYAQGLGE